MNLKTMVEDEESHAPGPYIPPDHKKKKEPTGKTNTAAILVYTPPLCIVQRRPPKTPVTTLVPLPKKNYVILQILNRTWTTAVY